MALFGKDIVKLIKTTPDNKPNKPNKGIQGDRKMRVKRNGVIIKQQ